MCFKKEKKGNIDKKKGKNKYIKGDVIVDHIFIVVWLFIHLSIDCNMIFPVFKIFLLAYYRKN